MFKKVMLVVVFLTVLLASGNAEARRWGRRGWYRQPAVVVSPVVVQPRPVFVQQSPVFVQQSPVVVRRYYRNPWMARRVYVW